MSRIETLNLIDAGAGILGQVEDVDQGASGRIAIRPSVLGHCWKFPADCSPSALTGQIEVIA